MKYSTVQMRRVLDHFFARHYLYGCTTSRSQHPEGFDRFDGSRVHAAAVCTLMKSHTVVYFVILYYSRYTSLETNYWRRLICWISEFLPLQTRTRRRPRRRNR